MPARITIEAGSIYVVNGVPLTLIATRGKGRAYLAVATTSDSVPELLAAAETWREGMEKPIVRHRRIDRNPPAVNDEANPCPPSQASG